MDRDNQESVDINIRRIDIHWTQIVQLHCITRQQATKHQQEIVEMRGKLDKVWYCIIFVARTKPEELWQGPAIEGTETSYASHKP